MRHGSRKRIITLCKRGQRNRKELERLRQVAHSRHCVRETVFASGSFTNQQTSQARKNNTPSLTNYHCNKCIEQNNVLLSTYDG